MTGTNYKYLCQGLGGKLFKYFTRNYEYNGIKSFAVGVCIYFYEIGKNNDLDLLYALIFKKLKSYNRI